MQGISLPGAPSQHSEAGPADSKGKEGTTGTTIPTPGEDGLLLGHRSLGQAALQEPPVVPPSFSETQHQCLQQEGQGSPSHSVIPSMVDLVRLDQGHSVQGTPQDHPHHRRQSVRLGGTSSEPLSPGSVVQFRPGSQYKLAGAQGHPPGSPQILPPCVRETRINPDRQHCGQGSHKQTRGHPFLDTHAGGPGHRALGRVQSELHQGGTHIGGGKSAGRFPEQGHSGPLRVETGLRPVQGNITQVQTAHLGSLRLPEQYSAPQVLFQVPDKGGGENRRPPEQMAGGSALCLPSSSATTSDYSQAPPGTGGANLSCSILAKTPVVCRPGGPVALATMEDPPGPSSSQSGEPPTSGSTVAPISRLALEREGLTRQSFSSGVISVIQASRRPSTNRIYDATWRNFCSWCHKKRLSPLAVTIPDILDYLLEGLNRGLSTSTIRRQIAALSTVLTCDNQVPLSQHPAVSAFLKGAANVKPPTVHRYPSWDLSKVLQALTSPPFEPLSTCSFHFLTLKVAFLVAITSARRISELAALSVREDLCTFHEDRVVLRLDPAFIPKVNTGFHRSQDLVLPNFCPNPSHRLERQWHTLDVRRALRHYIKRTSAFRKSEALFVSFQPSAMGRKVSSSTIGWWIRACISRVYVSQSLPVPSHITAHSTRSAAASAAWSTQASLEEICRAATWSSPSSFIKHYRIDQFAAAEAAFGRRVLQQVVSSQGTQA